MQVRLSWIEQFMNWYPRNTRLYRRKSKEEGDFFALMKISFDELKPFFINMALTISNDAKLDEQENRLQLAQSVLNCNTILEAKAMAQQAIANMITIKDKLI